MVSFTTGCWGQRTSLEKGLIVGICCLLITTIGLLIGLIVIAPQDSSPAEPNFCLTEGCILAANSLFENMKPDLDPCDDFYEFACGRFLDESIIPDESVEVSAFSEINENLKYRLQRILAEPTNATDIKPFKNLKKFYQSCLNLTAIENIGTSSVLSKITQMGGWPVLTNDAWDDSNWTWESTIAKMNSFGGVNSQIFAFTVTMDLRNSTRRVGAIDQTELGLEYEYIIKKDDDDEYYLAYKDYQIDLALLFGSTLTRAQVEIQMGQALEFEYMLANISIPREERRDANLFNNPMTITELQEKYNYIQWLEYLNSLMPADTQFTSSDVIINGAPSFFKKLGTLLVNTPKKIIANYLMWRFVLSSVPYMGQTIRDRQQEYNRVTIGSEKELSRTSICTNIVNKFFSHALGSLYIRKYFNEEAKDNVMQIVNNLKIAFKEILEEVDWMDEKTKEAARNKVDAMKSQMAYADELLDDVKLTEYYSNIKYEIDIANFHNTAFELNFASTNYEYGKLRQPVDKNDWSTFITPAMVNAFYSPLENTIKFPAAILQGAFFNADQPHYLNYGAIGFVIGHEITHGFDDQGSRYDLNGNLNNWWDSTIRENFEQRAQCLISQYGNFTEPKTGLKLIGINTQGENIADNGGIKESYRAYEKLIAKIGEEPLLPGIYLNQRQLFWVSAALVWCNVQREETTKMQIYTDNHSPERFRVIGSFQNRPEFARDFHCPIGSPMNPSSKCSVW